MTANEAATKALREAKMPSVVIEKPVTEKLSFRPNCHGNIAITVAASTRMPRGRLTPTSRATRGRSANHTK